MTQNLEERLFVAAVRNIRSEWKKRKGIQSFVNLAIRELRYLQGDYKFQKAEIIAQVVKQKLAEAAQNLQLQITTRLESNRFPRYRGISLAVSNKNKLYGEIFIGPVDEWDKLMFLPPEGTYNQHQENPYSKKRRKKWQTVAQFDFDAFMSAVKTEIDRPPPIYEDYEDEVLF